MKTIVASILLTVVLSGCASTPFDYKTGTEITAAQVAQFTPGKTTQTQVISAVGQPSKKEPLSGKEAWYYDYNKVGALFGGNVSESTVSEWDTKGNLLQVYKTGKSGKTGNALLDAANGNK